MKYVSPRALINALLPGASPAAMAKGVDEGGRVAAFKRYIAGGCWGGVLASASSSSFLLALS